MSDATPLSQIFLGNLGPAVHPNLAEEPTAMESWLVSLYSDGLKFWGDLKLAPADFVQYIAQRTPAGSSPKQQAAKLHTRDLYLTCGCARSLPDALTTFDRQILSRVPSFIARIDSAPHFADEVMQALRIQWLLSPADGEPGITKYGGAGGIFGWVKVGAGRKALELRRSRDHRPAQNIDQLMLAAMPIGGTPEMEEIVRRFQADFNQAFYDALASLDPEQRKAVRGYYLLGFKQERLAADLAISVATLKRRLQSAYEHLRDEPFRLLRQRLRVSESELASLIQAVRSRLELRLSILLRDIADDQDP